MSTKYIIKKPFGGLKIGMPVYPPKGTIQSLLERGLIEEVEETVVVVETETENNPKSKKTKE